MPPQGVHRSASISWATDPHFLVILLKGANTPAVTASSVKESGVFSERETRLFRTDHLASVFIRDFLQQQPIRSHTPLEGLHESTNTSSPVSSHVPVSSPKPLDIPTSTASNVSRTNALFWIGGITPISQLSSQHFSGNSVATTTGQASHAYASSP